MAKTNGAVSQKPHILLNAFDMSTVGHLSPGQWKVRNMKHCAYRPLKLITEAESQRSLSDKTKA
jgi:hypothetical protein